MLKIAFLVRRPDLTDAAFRSHWRGTHGHVVSRSPGYAAYRTSYTQNHVVRPAGLGRPFAWSGMAEFTLPGESANEDDFATTEIYRDRIAVDERRFIDMDATVSFTASEQWTVSERGPAKVVLVAKHRPNGMTPAEAAQQALEALGAEPPIVGWSVNTVLPGSFRLPGSRSVDDAPEFDAVHELWLAGSEMIAPAVLQLEGALASSVALARSWSFVADEFVFFADGRPVDPLAI